MPRHGRVTSTHVKQILSSKNQGKTAEDIVKPKNISRLKYVSQGIRDEKLGVDFLLQMLATDGVEAVAYPVGFITHSEHSWLGATPDSLLQMPDGSWCCVEVKSWYVTEKQKSLRDLPYLDCAGALRKSHSHYYQIQTAMLVTGLDFCYFVVSGQFSSVQVIKKDAPVCQEILERCKPFYFGLLLPLVKQTIKEDLEVDS